MVVGHEKGLVYENYKIKSYFSTHEPPSKLVVFLLWKFNIPPLLEPMLTGRSFSTSFKLN